MKKITSLLLSLSLALSLAACGNTSDTPTTSSAPVASSSAPAASEPVEKSVTLKLGHKMNAESLDGQAFQMFADLVSEKSNGTVKVDVFPASQLGDGVTQVNNVLLGSQDIYAESISEWSGITPLADVGGSVPFLFNSMDDYFDLVRGDFGKEQEAAMEAGGAKVLTTERNWIRGPYRVLCSTKPIQSLEDLQGLRLRTWENASYMTCWDNLGTAPIVIGWTDTYLALSQGTADAVTSPASQVEQMAFHEVAPYITNINEFPQEISVVMNKATFDSLSATQQQALIDAANEAGEWASVAVYDEVEASIARMKEAGAIFYEMDTSPCTEKLTDTYKELEATGALPAGLLASLGIG